MKTITHIDKQRTEGIVNPLLVQKKFKLSEMEYKQLIYNLGIQFLQEVYVNDQWSVATFERSVYFWKWWKNEFIQWELGLMMYIESNQKEVDKDYYNYCMDNLANHDSTYESFETFLKLYGSTIIKQSKTSNQ